MIYEKYTIFVDEYIPEKFKREITQTAEKVIANTAIAIDNIMRNCDKNTFNKNFGNRLKSANDIGNVTGILGEIRAYGYLQALSRYGLECDIISTSNKEQKPDFKIKRKDFTILIEVHTKNVDPELTKRIEERRNNTCCNNFMSILPFGWHEEYNTTSIVKHKISQIKGKSEQLARENKQDKDINILWLDFQTNLINIISEKTINPIRTCNGYINSGEIWYAFYGEYGLPIFEGEHPHQFDKMSHENFFRKNEHIDYVIISFMNTTVILENHIIEKEEKTRDTFLKILFNYLIRLRNFEIQYSYVGLSKDDLKNRIDFEKIMIKNFDAKFRKKWSHYENK